MSGPDAMPDEMPGFFPGRPGGDHDEPLLDMLLERRPIPPGAPSELHDLSRLLAAAAGPAESGDLAGEDAARAAFRRLPSPAGASHAAPRSARHRLTGWPARGKLPLAAALAVAAAGLGSATAAYVGALPSPIQHFAHMVIGAPPPHDGLSGQPLVVSSSRPAPAPQVSTPAPGKTLRVSSAAPSRPKPTNWQWRSRNPRYSPGPAVASCHPAPGPAHPAPSPSSRHLGPVPGPAGPRSSQPPGRSRPAQDLTAPRPSASSWAPSPSGTSCPSVPG